MSIFDICIQFNNGITVEALLIHKRLMFIIIVKRIINFNLSPRDKNITGVKFD